MADSTHSPPARRHRAALPRAPDRASLGWAMYDFFYSMFLFLLLAVGVAPWIVNDLGRPDILISLTQVALAATEVLLMPMLGRRADRTGHRLRMFLWFTLCSAAFAALLGVVDAGAGAGVVLVLVLAGASGAMLQFAYAQYEPLLASVTSLREQGRVSGRAVGLGFLGVVVATIVAVPFDAPGSRQQMFAPSALVLALGVTACWMLMRPRVHSLEHPNPSITYHGLVGELAAGWHMLRREPDITRLLVAKFLYTDATATVLTYLLVYMKRLGGLSTSSQHLVLALGITCGAAASLVSGPIVERTGPRRPLLVMLPTLAAAIALAAIVGKPWTMWALAPVVGAALGTIWTADRIFLLRLVHPHARGEAFGFFSIVNRAAGSLGPLVLWGAVIYVLWNVTGLLDALDASRVALGMLATSVVVGWLVVRTISDEPRHG